MSCPEGDACLTTTELIVVEFLTCIFNGVSCVSQSMSMTSTSYSTSSWATATATTAPPSSSVTGQVASDDDGAVAEKKPSVVGGIVAAVAACLVLVALVIFLLRRGARSWRWGQKPGRYSQVQGRVDEETSSPIWGPANATPMDWISVGGESPRLSAPDHRSTLVPQRLGELSPYRPLTLDSTHRSLHSLSTPSTTRFSTVSTDNPFYDEDLTHSRTVSTPTSRASEKTFRRSLDITSPVDTILPDYYTSQSPRDIPSPPPVSDLPPTYQQ